MKIFTISQAGKYCGVPPETVLGWIKGGKLLAETAAGGHRRIRKDDVDRYLMENNLAPGNLARAEERKKILVVDDDDIIVETIVQCLEEDEHCYELYSATDGFEAEAQIKHFNPDLMILDIMMPDINGYEVCRKIKSDKDTRDIKIIVLSAYMDEKSSKKMNEYGADACFSKPLPLPELRQQVAKLLS
ncbi:MAG: histidine kinase [Spirochaetes bacterium RBG_16_49_21]|jgi:excisionase family DNA binding protein|nr:MAG: histidine kinase [Spirochaetes bacterium RBG_16_49_21]